MIYVSNRSYFHLSNESFINITWTSGYLLFRHIVINLPIKNKYDLIKVDRLRANNQQYIKDFDCSFPEMEYK